MSYSQKDYSGPVIDIDTVGRNVKAVWSAMETVDLDKEMIPRKSFIKTLSERGPSGSSLIWSLTDHIPSLAKAIGKPSEISEQGDQLISITPITKTTWGNDVMQMYVDGLINQHSIGFSTIKWDWTDSKQEVRVLKEVKLYEGSAVLWGAHPSTPTLGIKSMNPAEQKQSLNDRLDKLYKSFRHGIFTDETFSIMEIEIKQIQKAITELDTPPVVETVEPLESKDLLDALSNFSQTFKNLTDHGRNKNSGGVS